MRTFGLRILQELRQDVHEVGAVERITTNAHTRGLTQASGGGLCDSLVCQSTGARDDTCITNEQV